MMKMGRLCQGLIPIRQEIIKDIQIKGLTYDSRNVKPGDLFIAIDGFQTDGHQYIDQAVQKGAAAIIVEKEIVKTKVPILRVENTRRTMALLANRFYDEPTKNLLVIGITGTNGKTTVAYLISSILSAAGIESAMFGTIVYRWKDYEITATRTTPEALDIFRYMRRVRDEGGEAVVMEVSSHALALERVISIPYRVGIFTNLSRDHLDFHDSYEAYGEAKAGLFSLIEKGGVGVIYGDDPFSSRMIQACKEKTVTYGAKEENDYRIEALKHSEKQNLFLIHHGKNSYRFSTSLWGWFNILNAGASAIVGLELGLKPDDIQKGLDQVTRVSGRMDGIESKDGVRIVVDYAHTPDALKNILSAARDFTKGRLIVVFGCGGDRDRGKRPLMGQYAEELADLIYVTSDNPRTEDPEKIIQDILKGFGKKETVVVIENRKEAIHRVLDIAEPGDTVVVAGKGHETYQEIGYKRFPFDDRSVVQQYLSSLGKF